MRMSAQGLIARLMASSSGHTCNNTSIERFQLLERVSAALWKHFVFRPPIHARLLSKNKPVKGHLIHEAKTLLCAEI